jgi:uncharacterized protein
MVCPSKVKKWVILSNLVESKNCVNWHCTELPENTIQQALQTDYHCCPAATFNLKETTMTIGMYSASVPVLVRMLNNVLGWLDKAQTHAEVKKFESSVFLAARLAPDMLPFSKQIQIACDMSKFCIARLGGVEAPKFEDNESSIAELRVRITKTVAFIQTAAPAQINGTEDKDITIPMRSGPLHLKGEDYLTSFVLPNLYFHLTTAYALLRHNGVDLGKGDFLGTA